MDIKQFLNRISQIESSGGKNLDHEEMQHGIQKGTRAIGQYGLMPNTINEIINRQKAAHISTPEIEELQNLDRDSIAEKFQQNPELETNLAEFLANHIAKRQNNNENAMAYSWFNGHNTKPKDISSQKLLTSDYVGKYIRTKRDEAINALNQETSENEDAKRLALAKMMKTDYLF